jgi:hypothetical protein
MIVDRKYCDFGIYTIVVNLKYIYANPVSTTILFPSCVQNLVNRHGRKEQ